MTKKPCSCNNCLCDVIHSKDDSSLHARSEAWYKVCETIHEVAEDIYQEEAQDEFKSGKTIITNVIRRLAERNNAQKRIIETLTNKLIENKTIIDIQVTVARSNKATIERLYAENKQLQAEVNKVQNKLNALDLTESEKLKNERIIRNQLTTEIIQLRNARDQWREEAQNHARTADSRKKILDNIGDVVAGDKLARPLWTNLPDFIKTLKEKANNIDNSQVAIKNNAKEWKNDTRRCGCDRNRHPQTKDCGKRY